jgi:hypothetical protein
MKSTESNAEAFFYWYRIYELLITKPVNMKTKKEF